MSYILAYRDEPVPAIPDPPVEESGLPAGAHASRTPDRREHFGTEEAALRRAAELLPGPTWRHVRLYGPDGVRIASQEQLEARLAKTRLRPAKPPG